MSDSQSAYRREHRARIISIPFTSYRFVVRSDEVSMQRRDVDANGRGGPVGRWRSIERWSR